ncbi:hypothetical protein ABT160_03160 [Streptomyces sp. NPDC001941]|uniref:hypothetical protein n=1 Tax=Streptomyces sp. NPDC001941 TaxID=3154659 RepID=UPI00331A68E2
MADRPLNSLQSRTLRWLLLICLCGVAAGLAAPVLLGAVLPAHVYRDVPDGAVFWAVVVLAAALCALIAVRTRRRRGGGAG